MALGPGGLPPGAFSRTLFVSFHVVSFLYSFGYFSFLCLENCPWKLSKGAFSRTLFLFFRFCIVLAMFPSFALKIDLGNCPKALFLEPFSFFFRFFSPLPSKLTWKLSKGTLSRTFRVSFCCFSYFSSFAFKLDFGNCQKEFFLRFFSFFSVFFRYFFVSSFIFVFIFVFCSFPLSFSLSFSFFSFPFSCSFSFSFFSFNFSCSVSFSLFFHCLFHVRFHVRVFFFSIHFSFPYSCFHVLFCFGVKVYVRYFFQFCSRFFLTFNFISYLIHIYVCV